MKDYKFKFHVGFSGACFIPGSEGVFSHLSPG